MDNKNNLSTLLSRLPLATAGVLSPTDYRLLDFLIRYGYNYGSEPFCVTNDALTHGVLGVEATYPLLVSRRKFIHHNTLSSSKRVLEGVYKVGHTLRRIPNSYATASVYTLNLEYLHEAINTSYEMRYADNIYKGLPDPKHLVLEPDKVRNRGAMVNIAHSPRLWERLYGLKISTQYVYQIIFSLCMGLRCLRLKNLPAKLSKLLKGAVSRSVIYRAVQELSDIHLLRLEYGGYVVDEEEKPAYVLNVNI